MQLKVNEDFTEFFNESHIECVLLLYTSASYIRFRNIYIFIIYTPPKQMHLQNIYMSKIYTCPEKKHLLNVWYTLGLYKLFALPLPPPQDSMILLD